jgi:nitrite reductase/ring-hydroxylating ferredoxin subunit/uncharacterized membrane protein
MQSRAQFKGHPIHPALIPFPFAFLTGALLFDTLGFLRGSASLWTTGAYLTIAGLGAGIITAIPGIIDYLYTVPPQSSARERATKHGGANVLALLLFAAAFALRGDDWSPGVPTLVLELLGGAALAYAGSLGGTLVTRNLISVDHRFAGAGRWQESDIASHGTASVVIGHADDLQENQMKLLRVNGRRLVLGRTADGYRVFDDRCTHRGGSLAGGVMICGTVQCLWHGSQFDVSTGAVTCGPAKERIRTYAVDQKANGQLVLASPPE